MSKEDQTKRMLSTGKLSIAGSIRELENETNNSDEYTLATSNQDDLKKNSELEFKRNSDLHLSYRLVYKPSGVVHTSKLKKEPESAEYGAFQFSLNNIHIVFRVAKTTPTKTGQFVTLWKRIGNGPIMPYDTDDPVDVFVVCVREGRNFGQFVFSKSILESQGIISKSGKGGKRAVRLYAPWVKTTSSQAAASKSWQTKYFLDLSDTGNIDLKLVRKLYGFK